MPSGNPVVLDTSVLLLSSLFSKTFHFQAGLDTDGSAPSTFHHFTRHVHHFTVHFHHFPRHVHHFTVHFHHSPDIFTLSPRIQSFHPRLFITSLHICIVSPHISSFYPMFSSFHTSHFHDFTSHLNNVTPHFIISPTFHHFTPFTDPSIVKDRRSPARALQRVSEGICEPPSGKRKNQQASRAAYLHRIGKVAPGKILTVKS